MDKSQTDKLWGIERNKNSSACGRLVVPVIWLWERPAFIESLEHNQVVAVAEHDTKVTVVEMLKVGGFTFYRIQPERAEWVGRTRRLRARLARRKPEGWVKKEFLLNRGFPRA